MGATLVDKDKSLTRLMHDGRTVLGSCPLIALTCWPVTSAHHAQFSSTVVSGTITIRTCNKASPVASMCRGIPGIGRGTTDPVCLHLSAEFPHRLSYHRVIDLIPRLMVPMETYLRQRMGRCTGVSFVDSTPLAVCKNPRIAHPSGLCGSGSAEPNLGRQVLWPQIAGHHQRPGGGPCGPTHGRQCR